MVEHMVWFKMKEGVSEEQQEAMVAGALKMVGKIDGVLELSSGRDFSGRSKGFEVGLYVRLESKEALANYAPHPAHQAFVQEFKPLWEEVMALDFEC